MSIFAAQTQETIALPMDPGQSVTIRKLTGREVERAQAEHLRGFMGRSSRGWAASFQRLLETGTATDVDAARVIADPLNGYDRATVLRCGLVAWTYDRAVTPEAIDGIDDEAAELLAVAIMRLTKPTTAAEAEAERGKG